MKKLEKIGKSVLALSILANTFAPLGTVYANANPFTVTVSVENAEVFQISQRGNTNEIQVAKGTTADYDFITFKNSSNHNNIEGLTLSCSSNSCTFSIPGGVAPELVYSGSKLDITKGSSVVEPGGIVDEESELSIKEEAETPPPPPGTNEDTRDKEAVLVWSCGNKICYHLFENLDEHDRIHYIDASTITDDNDSSKKFDVHADTKFFASTTRFATKKAEIDASNAATTPTLNIEDLKGEDGIDYRPVGEPTENNAYVSYADRNFKAIIYNNKFKALKMGNFSDLTYYPGKWNNELTRRESFDISDTTKENPVEFETVLLESVFRLKADEFGGLTIKSITPLDVPEGAVTVEKIDSEYEFTFQSKFYNKVVFKLVDEDDKEYFFRINRQAMSIDARGDKEHTWEITSDVYFRNNLNWDDLNVTARIAYKDGTSKLVEMENAKHIDDGLGNSKDIYENDEEHPSNSVWPVGKGLKRAVFKIELEPSEVKKIDKIYFNIDYKGSTSTTYVGNYAGSGKGEVLDFSEEKYQRSLN